MSGSALELLDLIARWIHVIAGIMWIGNSLLFNWLDKSLRPPEGRGQTPQPLGTIWLLRSGGFYYVEKTLLGIAHPATEAERLVRLIHNALAGAESAMVDDLCEDERAKVAAVIAARVADVSAP